MANFLDNAFIYRLKPKVQDKWLDRKRSKLSDSLRRDGRKRKNKKETTIEQFNEPTPHCAITNGIHVLKRSLQQQKLTLHIGQLFVFLLDNAYTVKNPRCKKRARQENIEIGLLFRKRWKKNKK